MSITTLTTEATEESTYAITASFTDENGNAVIPNADTVTWTLTDTEGTVINSREKEAVASASSIEIVLTGDDLSIQSGETSKTVKRRFLIEARFDSDLGSDLYLKDECEFAIRNLAYVS